MNAKEMTVWIAGLALLALFLLSPAACTMHRHYRVEQAIKSGADPIDVKCALESDTTHTPVCVLRAADRKAKW